MEEVVCVIPKKWQNCSWHILGICLIPERSLLLVDRGNLHVGPTKSLTFSPGDLRVAMRCIPL